MHVRHVHYTIDVHTRGVPNCLVLMLYESRFGDLGQLLPIKKSSGFQPGDGILKLAA